MKLTVQGQEAYCYTGGKTFDSTLPTAVFIHGAQSDHSVWLLQTRYFAHHGFGVLAVDLPGHNRSKGKPLPSVEAMAEWLLALLDAAGVQQATLIGHSMGSLIALEAAGRAPQRVSHLGLVGTAYPMKVSDMLLTAARDDEPSAVNMVNIWSHASRMHKPSPSPGFSVLGGGHRLLEKVGHGNTEKVFHIDFTACNAYAGGEKSAANIKCPTMLLLGERDVMTQRKDSAVLTAAMPHAKVQFVPDCGHSLMVEQPDAVRAALFSFAQS